MVNKKSLAFLATTGGMNQPIDARAVIEVLLASLGYGSTSLRSRIDATAASLGTVVAGFEGRLNRHLDTFSNDVQRFSDTKGEIERDINRARGRYAQFRSTIATGLIRMRADYSTIRRTYETAMALKAPATYWQNRARVSSAIAAGSFGGFVIAAVIVGLILSHYGPDLRAWIMGPEGRVDTAALVALAPIALLMLWLFRFFTRLYGVAISEAVDAGQRRVMVTTFLAIA